MELGELPRSKNAPEKRGGSLRRPAGVHVGAGGVDVDPNRGLADPADSCGWRCNGERWRPRRAGRERGSRRRGNEVRREVVGFAGACPCEMTLLH